MPNSLATSELASSASVTGLLGAFPQSRCFSPRDLILGAKWTSALFTTYSFSACFFEAVPLPGMARSARHVTVMADLVGYSASLAEAGAVGMGRSYQVIPVGVPDGVFHPKVSVLVERGETVRAMMGSGNLTFGGWGYNAEVADVLVPGADSTAYRDLAEFLATFAEQAGPGRYFSSSQNPDLEEYVEACRAAAAKPGSGRSRVLHTLAGPLCEQIAGMAAELGGAVALTVVSPFFSGHHGVKRLATALGGPVVSVAVPPLAPFVFDFDAARADGFEVASVASDAFFGDTKRSLHAKAFDIECRDGRLLVSGSANATLPALLDRNVEAVVARVVPRGRSLGWRPCGTWQGSTDGGQDHEQQPTACLAAHLEAGRICGMMFGVRDPAGEWDAALRCGTERRSFGHRLAAEPDGSFAFEIGDADLAALGASAQLVLARGEEELRGWLMQGDLLAAVRAKGPIANSISRVASGRGGNADIAAILDYILHSTTEMIDAADRGITVPVARPRQRVAHAAAVPIDRLRPISALQLPSVWTDDSGSVSFKSLLDGLMRHLATALPMNDVDDEEEEEEPPGPPAGGGKGSRGGGSSGGNRVPGLKFGQAFKALADKVAAVPAGPARIPSLHMLLGMIVLIAPRCDDPETLTLACLQRWLGLALGCREGDGQDDGLGRVVAAVLAKLTMDGALPPVKCHSTFQEWMGGVVDPLDLPDLEPDPLGLDERRLAPGATPEAWHAAWRVMTSTTTPLARMHELRTALASGDQWDPPPGATADESALLERIAAGKSRLNMAAIMEGKRSGSCPACHMEMTRPEQARLRTHRIATCRWCQRVVLDLSV